MDAGAPDAGALVRGAELFRLLVDTVEDYAIAVLAPDGRVLCWNAGAVHTLGWAPDEIVGKPIDVIFTEEDRKAGAPEQEKRIAQASGRSEDERYHLRRDGSRFWSSGVLVALRDERGELMGYGKILRDRTDNRELQEALRNRAAQLAQADEDKNIFLATLAHELRTPLAVILNASALLRLDPGADRTRVADWIERQVRHSQRVIEDLLDIVRAGRDKLVLERSPLDLRDVAAHAADMVRPAMNARRQQFYVDQPDEPLIVAGEANRLLQIFVNLLNNAMKFTPEGGRISFSTMRQADEVVARVEDNGVGIPPEKLAAVFDLFSQATPATPGSPLGVGIGLALVRELVALHAGTVQALSPGVGKGSAFIVRLPAVSGSG